jgi:hypothetical protein
MENPHIDWLAARSGSVAAQGGAEVYKALGAGDNITYWSDVADGTHCAVRPEWRTPLQQNIQKFLVGTGNAAGTFRISGLKAGNLADWRDWTTPTLSDGGGTTTPPVTTPPVTTPPVTTPPVTTTPPPGNGCSASLSLNVFTGGFVATIRVTAGAAAISGWTVSLTLPSGTTISNAWNSAPSGNTGPVQFGNLGYNGSVGAGQFTEFGFQATGPAPTGTPACAAG